MTRDINIQSELWASIPELDSVIEMALEAALAELDDPTLMARELSIVLADDAMIAALNREWRGKDAPTNVLSFPQDETDMVAVPESERPLGDIVLAFETVKREAGLAGIPHRHHIQHLVVHGLLHLLGYDHDTDDRATHMEGLEVAILARIGVENPYPDLTAETPETVTQRLF